jgi:hypothetical protein
MSEEEMRSPDEEALLSYIRDKYDLDCKTDEDLRQFIGIEMERFQVEGLEEWFGGGDPYDLACEHHYFMYVLCAVRAVLVDRGWQDQEVRDLLNKAIEEMGSDE